MALGGGVVGDVAGFAASAYTPRCPICPSADNLGCAGGLQRGWENGSQPSYGEKSDRSVLSASCRGD